MKWLLLMAIPAHLVCVNVPSDDADKNKMDATLSKYASKYGDGVTWLMEPAVYRTIADTDVQLRVWVSWTHHLLAGSDKLTPEKLQLLVNKLDKPPSRAVLTDDWRATLAGYGLEPIPVSSELGEQ